MTIVIATVLAAFLTIFGTRPLSPSETLRAIQPLAWSSMNEDGQVERSNHCTAWAYQEHWVTAAHCVVDEETGKIEDRDYTIDGRRALVLKVDVPYDLAVLASTHVPLGLRLATHQYTLDQVINAQAPIILRGYPFGWLQLQVSRGLLSSINYDVQHSGFRTWDIYSTSGAPGDSGAPMFNNHDEVIGLVQLGFCQRDGFCSAMAGSTLADLTRFLHSL